MLSIVTTPNPVLRETTLPVTLVDKKLLDLIQNMSKALIAAKDPEGVGLAAPQVGVPLKLFLIRPDFKKPPMLFINPEITEYSQRQQTPESKKGVYEGCLSLPHYYAPLKRSMSVVVKYQRLLRTFPSPSSIEEGVAHKPEEFLKVAPKLVEKTQTFSGLTAHVIQHEMDHLNGILFIDHVLSQNTKLFKIHGKTWEEITL